MSSPKVEMVLEYAGETVSALVNRTYTGIERQRFVWEKRYGLTKKKDYKIYLRIPSMMGNGLPIKSKFPIIKNKLNQNEETTIADSIG